METMDINGNKDQRGFVVNPFEHLENTGDITNFHAFSIEKNHSRGNHLHPARNEQVLVVAGEITVTTTAGTTRLNSGIPSILTIPEGMQHTFSNESDETAVVLCWSSRRDEDYQGEDTVRETIPGT